MTPALSGAARRGGAGRGIVNLTERHRRLAALLAEFHALWHAQPFRENRPAWCQRWPALTADLLALDDTVVEALQADAPAALAWLTRHLPALAEFAPLAELPPRAVPPAAALDDRWAWEIPGRKRAQIEAFAAAVVASGGQPVLDWCGGKGHLGRLLARQAPVHTLEIDAALCQAGEQLARRLGSGQTFVNADALAVDLRAFSGGHAVALHACGGLHRRLIRDGVAAGIARFDIAPCCYHLHLDGGYRPLAAASSLSLTADDVRLAVTETVTAGARERRRRDRALAWKLAFVDWRQEVSGAPYRSFKPVPEAWLRGDFAGFMAAMCRREGLAMPAAGDLARCEQWGEARRCEVQRLSIVRQALRRALETWLVGDLALFLQERGYAVELGVFCERVLTPRNLLISARRG
ncbi:MAG: SAM-dependent methyltransferase [Betaproteobacteria bacterium]|nr:SAM-dependent methyltransferase [Betaproteobacteria bacterium]MCL2886720.1 SAM-dependent methyltransferase [Betaproteobacteria bacterium]